MSDMKDVDADLARPGSPADRKTRASTTAVVGFGAAGLASTILWGFGCLKGHQFYTPDDALVLTWAACLAPILHALYMKLYRLVGAGE